MAACLAGFDEDAPPLDEVLLGVTTLTAGCAGTFLSFFSSSQSSSSSMYSIPLLALLVFEDNGFCDASLCGPFDLVGVLEGVLEGDQLTGSFSIISFSFLAGGFVGVVCVCVCEVAVKNESVHSCMCNCTFDTAASFSSSSVNVFVNSLSRWTCFSCSYINKPHISNQPHIVFIIKPSVSLYPFLPPVVPEQLPHHQSPA